MHAPNPVLVLDHRGAIVLWNQALARMSGYPAEEAVGRDFATLVLGEDQRPFVENTLSRILQGEVVSDLELRLCDRDDNTVLVLSQWYPIYDADGTVTQCAIAGTDGAALQCAVAAHEESEERYRALSAASFEGIMISRNGMLLDANENLARLSGYELNELRGRVVADLAPHSFRGVELADIASDTGKPHEFQFFRKDGAVVPVEVRGKTIRFLGESATVWSIRDLSEIRRAQEAIEGNRESIRAIFESVRDCVFVKDMELRYIHVNPAMLKLLDLKPSQIIGKTAENIFGREKAAHIRSVELRVLQGETIEQEHTFLVNGELLTFQDVRAPLRGAEGRIIGLCGISRNITDRKRAIADSRRRRQIIRRPRGEPPFIRHGTRHPEREWYCCSGRAAAARTILPAGFTITPAGPATRSFPSTARPFPRSLPNRSFSGTKPVRSPRQSPETRPPRTGRRWHAPAQ